VNRNLGRVVRTTLDTYAAMTLPECGAYVALSGSGLASGRVAQSRGSRYICDRGSSHIRYQDGILAEEYARWKIEREPVDPFFIDREEREYEQADALVVPSAFSERTFVEMGVAPEKLHRIPYGVRLDRFRPTAEPPPDAFNILFAGSVSLRKGVPYLLEAFRRFRHPRKRLWVAGAVLPEMRGLLAQHSDLAIQALGPVPQSRLVELMSTSHVLVLPSIEDGFGLVLGQALACGCPVISSTNTGAADLIADGVHGFLVPIRDSASIADRLQQLADDPLMLQQMRGAALSQVKKIGGWNEYGQSYAELIGSLTAAESRPEHARV
jgi:starch synthase